MTRGKSPTCIFAGCQRATIARGLCVGHYDQRRRGKPLTQIPEIIPAACRLCSVPACGRATGRRAKLCELHLRHVKDGRPLAPIKTRGWRTIVSNPSQPGTSLVPLTKGKVAIIDDRDVARVGGYSWKLVSRPSKSTVLYASTVIDGKTMHLHRFLWAGWGLESTRHLDHRNRNGLDCRRSNIRAATESQNQCNKGAQKNNTSGVKGVSWNCARSLWHASIAVGRKYYHLGYFSRLDEAAEAYAEAAHRLHGEFARLA